MLVSSLKGGLDETQWCDTVTDALYYCTWAQGCYSFTDDGGSQDHVKAEVKRYAGGVVSRIWDSQGYGAYGCGTDKEGVWLWQHTK